MRRITFSLWRVAVLGTALLFPKGQTCFGYYLLRPPSPPTHQPRCLVLSRPMGAAARQQRDTGSSRFLFTVATPPRRRKKEAAATIRRSTALMAIPLWSTLGEHVPSLTTDHASVGEALTKALALVKIVAEHLFTAVKAFLTFHIPFPDWAQKLALEAASTAVSWAVPLLVIVSFARSLKGDESSSARRPFEIEFSLNDDASESSGDGFDEFLREIGLGGGGDSTAGGSYPAGSTKRSRPNRQSVGSLITVRQLNARLESFAFDVSAAADGRYEALRERRKRRLSTAVQDETREFVDKLRPQQLSELTRAESRYKTAVNEARAAQGRAKASIRRAAVRKGRPAKKIPKGSSIAAKAVSGPEAKQKLDENLEKLGPAVDEPMDLEYEEDDEEKLDARFSELRRAVARELRAESRLLTTLSKIAPSAGQRVRLEHLVAATREEDVPVDLFLQHHASVFAAAKATNASTSSSSNANANETKTATTTATTTTSDEGKSTDDSKKKAVVVAKEDIIIETKKTKRPRTYVLSFTGDAEASQTAFLRNEITAVLGAANATNGDDVVIRLTSPGGTVTGYGNAAGQLLRVKAAGLPLTVVAEEVAASGGYLMACCADRLIASPFAVLGSIGVITEIPNLYERLKREGVAYQTVTAGKYKRTVTATKQVKQEDLDKTKAELEDVLSLFKNHVKENRPHLDVDKVATGETWFGDDALKLGLADEIKTFDDVLLEKHALGRDVLGVAFKRRAGPSLLDVVIGSGDGDDGARGSVAGITSPAALSNGGFPLFDDNVHDARAGGGPVARLARRFADALAAALVPRLLRVMGASSLFNPRVHDDDPIFFAGGGATRARGGGGRRPRWRRRQQPYLLHPDPPARLEDPRW